MRNVPTAEANVIANTIFGNPTQRVIQGIHAQLRLLPVSFRTLLDPLVIHVGEDSVVDLEKQPGLMNFQILLSQASARANTCSLSDA